MTAFVIATKTSLRQQPDDSTPEVVPLNVNDLVEGLHRLSTWEKASYADRAGKNFFGWVHFDALKEVSRTEFKLHDEPFGRPTSVSGELFEVKIILPPWRKVRVRLDDGSIVEGWLDDSAVTGAAPSAGTPAAGGADESELVLGPNEEYRPYLLKGRRTTDIDASALAAIIDAEASKAANGKWNKDSVAATSGAAGLTQFIPGTWIAHARKSGTFLNQSARARSFVTASNDVAPGKETELLALRFDPELSILSAAEYGRLNFDALVNENLVDDQIGDDEKCHFIYLAHHEGLQGAKGFLRKTRSYTFSNLAQQVGAGKAQTLVNNANGDTTKAYRDWLEDYIDKHVQPSKFRKTEAPVLVGAGTTALQQFNGPAIPVAELSNKKELARAIQWRLSELGYLDPPADGLFLQVSIWALGEFCDLNGISLGDGFTTSLARRLLEPVKLLPQIVNTGDWFDKVIKYMEAKKYFICRHPDCKNIAYLEGVNPNGTPNDDAPNVFNDLRVVFTIDGNGRPKFTPWACTTEPGKFWTFHPMTPKGAARIAFNQYKAWVVGTHHAGTPQAHEALVQTAEVSVFRDLNMDFKRPGDRLDSGMFGINQHRAYGEPIGDLGRSSAGCLVGWDKDGHRKFMELVKDDPRYKVNHSYKFVTAIMPGDEVLA